MKFYFIKDFLRFHMNFAIIILVNYVLYIVFFIIHIILLQLNVAIIYIYYITKWLELLGKLAQIY